MTPRCTQRIQSRPSGFAGFGVLLAFVLFAGSFLGPEVLADREPSEFVVIVHPANPSTDITEDFLAQAFFKRTTRWSHGQAIQPVDLPLQSAVRRAFSSAVLKRSAPAVRGFWLQQIFSGRDVPPIELDSDSSVVRYVLGSPGAVGYVSASSGHNQAKVLTIR
jgi:ABC-type phosphate transport system substrate-binding protein